MMDEHNSEYDPMEAFLDQIDDEWQATRNGAEQQK